LLVYFCIIVGDPIIKRRKIAIPLTGLTPPHFYIWPKAGPGFPTP